VFLKNSQVTIHEVAQFLVKRTYIVSISRWKGNFPMGHVSSSSIFTFQIPFLFTFYDFTFPTNLHYDFTCLWSSVGGNGIIRSHKLFHSNLRSTSTCRMLKILSVELDKLPGDGGLVELYGYIAARDVVDPQLCQSISARMNPSLWTGCTIISIIICNHFKW
jgi:hypothetical protein